MGGSFSHMWHGCRHWEAAHWNLGVPLQESLGTSAVSWEQIIACRNDWNCLGPFGSRRPLVVDVVVRGLTSSTF